MKREEDNKEEERKEAKGRGEVEIDDNTEGWGRTGGKGANMGECGRGLWTRFLNVFSAVKRFGTP